MSKYRIGKAIDDSFLRYVITRDESIIGDLNLKIPNSVTSLPPYLFYNSSKLKSIELNSNLREIGAYAFYGCDGLTSINIPTSLERVGEGAFGYCDKLTEINYPGTINGWASINFESQESNPFYYGEETGAKLYINGVSPTSISLSTSNIGDYAFCHCSTLTSVSIGSSVSSIGAYAFKYCHGIKSISISEGVTEIGTGAFYHCNTLTSITLPKSLKSIGEDAFNYCAKMTSVTFKSSDTDLPNELFYRCDALTTIHINNSYSGATFYAGSVFKNISSLRTLYLPSNLGRLSMQAFYGCYNLTTIYYAGSVDNWWRKVHKYGWDHMSGVEKVVCSNGTITEFEDTIDDGSIIIPRT